MSDGQGPGLSNYTLGEQTGFEAQTLNTGQMPAHTHLSQTTVHANGRADSGTPSGGVPAAESAGTQVYATAPDGSTTMNTGMVTTQIGPAGSNQPFSVLQPLLVVNYIVCLEGIYPSRN